MSQQNGHALHLPKSRAEAAEILTEQPQTIEYRPQRHFWLEAMAGGARFPGLGAMLMDVERMAHYPDVRLPLQYFKSGVSNAKFQVTAGSEEQARFAKTTLERIWRNDLEYLQLSYDYGWWCRCTPWTAGP
jgi:hypothetical protein